MIDKYILYEIDLFYIIESCMSVRPSKLIVFDRSEMRC